MLKKTITFLDLDGNSVTEDFYFNLSKADIAEMEMSHIGGFSEYLKKIAATTDGKAIMASFKEIISLAVGKRSEDGRRFIKSQDIVDDFLQTDAYSELFVELVSNTDAAVKFISGIVPADLAIDTKASPSVATLNLPDGHDTGNAKLELPPRAPEDDPTPWITENREPTERELIRMSKEQMQEVFRRRAGNQ